MKLKGFDTYYSCYINMAGLILLFCSLGQNSLEANNSVDFYVRKDFTNEEIFTRGREDPTVDSQAIFMP